MRVFRSRPFVSGRSYKMDHSGNVSLAAHTYSSSLHSLLSTNLTDLFGWRSFSFSHKTQYSVSPLFSLRLTLTPLNLKFEGILSNGFVFILGLVILV